MQLHVRVRPTTLDGVVGQEKAVSRVRTVLKMGWGGRAWIITGHSGVGKTTLANIIALEGADPLFVEELDAQWLTPTRIQEIELDARFKALGEKQGKAYIVNEYHGMSAKAVTQMLTTLERLPSHVVFIFTSTLKGATLFEQEQIDADAFASRCVRIKLENGPAMRQDCARLAQKIAGDFGLNGLPERVYSEAMDSCGGNMRLLLSRIETGEFAEMAEQRDGWRRRLDMIAATKGERYDAERAELRRLLAS